MKHFIMLVFWMSTLSNTLSGFALRENDYNIAFLRAEVNCPSDSLFYAPENIKPECFTAALECIMKELEGPIKKECGDNERIKQALETLEIKINQRQSSSNSEKAISNDCACERWPEVQFMKFLEKYKSLLEQEKSFTSG